MKVKLFAYGFRSQFFLAGVAAVVLIPLWAVDFVAGTSVGSGWPPTLWHAHEMLFGFGMAAVIVPTKRGRHPWRYTFGQQFESH